jgi:anti-sigma regulatory factor (Ser/Thr protein kinase)
MAQIQPPLSCREHFIRFRSSQLRQSLSSQVTAISPLVDQLMMFVRNCRKTDGSELEIETAVREAIANAIIHGNHENPHKRVRVMCRCNSDGEVRITVRDEGPGFQMDAVPDPTSPENRLGHAGWRPACAVDGDCYFPLTMEQWVAAVFHVPESLIQVSLHITVRAR